MKRKWDENKPIWISRIIAGDYTEVSRFKHLKYLQNTYLSNIIPKSKLIELNAFLMDQFESKNAIKVSHRQHYRINFTHYKHITSRLSLKDEYIL